MGIHCNVGIGVLLVLVFSVSIRDVPATALDGRLGCAVLRRYGVAMNRIAIL